MRKGSLLAVLLAAAALPVTGSVAEIIGYNVPAPLLTRERVATLPVGQRAAWLAYLARSEAQMKVDRATLAAELKPGQTPPPPAKPGSGDYGMPLDKPAAWYAGPQARAAADNIVSYQTPAGGWTKNADRTAPPRLPGQPWSDGVNAQAAPDPANFDKPRDGSWSYVGTLDNGATTTEMAFLLRVAKALPGNEGAPYRASFVKGVRYLLAAQYPNGGWPQTWPLQGGYHDGITFNDNAMTDAATTLRAVATEPGYAFVPAALRKQAGAAVTRAIDVILAAQVRQNGKLTGWPQQVDALTLEPISARNYEMRSIASGETGDVLIFLMDQPRTPRIAAAVDGAIAWRQAIAVYDHAWTGKGTPEGRRLVPQKGAGPIWSRNYDVATNRAIFGDRDKSIHDDVNGISPGRRNGYSWYVTQPAKAIEAYAAWQQQQNRKGTGR